MAAIVKSQVLEMPCRSTESSVQLAGGVMWAEGPSWEIISALAGCGNVGPFFPRNEPFDGGRGNSDCGMLGTRNPKLVTPESRPHLAEHGTARAGIHAVHRLANLCGVAIGIVRKVGHGLLILEEVERTTVLVTELAASLDGLILVEHQYRVHAGEDRAVRVGIGQELLPLGITGE